MIKQSADTAPTLDPHVSAYCRDNGLVAPVHGVLVKLFNSRLIAVLLGYDDRIRFCLDQYDNDGVTLILRDTHDILPEQFDAIERLRSRLCTLFHEKFCAKGDPVPQAGRGAPGARAAIQCMRFIRVAWKELVLCYCLVKGIPPEVFQRINHICCRLGQVRVNLGMKGMLSPNKVSIGDPAFRDFLLELWRVGGMQLLDDLGKYPVGYTRYLVERLLDSSQSSYGDRQALGTVYRQLLATAPAFVKRFRYNLQLPERVIWLLEKRIIPMPRSRFAWFALLTYVKLQDNRLRAAALRSLALADKQAWDLFRRHTGESRCYSHAKLVRMFVYISDGQRLYQQHHDRCPQLHRIKLSRSLSRCMRQAIFNHATALHLPVEQPRNALPPAGIPVYRTELDPAAAMPGYDGLPEALEQYRIKTVDAMISAGQELGHCLGTNYAGSNDLFLRRNTVCLHICRRTLCILQCYDSRNRKTERSRSFETFVQWELDKWKKTFTEEQLQALQPVLSPYDAYWNGIENAREWAGMIPF